MNPDGIHILLVEDSAPDVELTRLALRDVHLDRNLSVVTDGEAALDYVRARGEHAGVARPHLILLDLNLPRKDGREVLRELKADPELRTIPVIVLTTSGADDDVLDAYRSHVNAYVQKPMRFEEFTRRILAVHEFWLTIATLPGEVAPRADPRP